MTTALRLKSFPEVLSDAFARFRKLRGKDSDLIDGSVERTILEITALSDAEQYVQIGKIPRLFNIFLCRGDDQDRRALDFGTLFNTDLRRRPAQPSVTKVAFGDGTQLVYARLASDAVAGDGSFTVESGKGDAFPSSGGAWLERGTVREERVVFLRSGDVFTVVSPSGGLAFAHAAYGEVALAAVHSVTTTALVSGGTSVTLAAGTGAAWPLSGSVVFDRGTTSAETLAFTRSGDVVTHDPVTFNHAIGASAILSTFGSDRSIDAGTAVYVPATETSKQVTFQTLFDATLFDGDYWSALVDAECTVVGKETNVGSGTVSAFSNLPFSNATVTNPLPAAGGYDREDDDDYPIRLVEFIASWGGRTGLSIAHHVIGLRDEVTNETCRFAQIIEPVERGLSVLYVTDGSANFAIKYVVFSGRDTLISDAAVGDRRGRLHAYAPFRKQAFPLSERTPRIFASVVGGVTTAVGANSVTDTSKNMVSDVYAGMWLKTSDDQFYEITANTAIAFTIDASGAIPGSGAYSVYDFETKSFLSSASTAVAVDTLVDVTQSMTDDAYVDYYLLDSAGVTWRITSNTSDTFDLAADGKTPAPGAYEIVLSNKSIPLEPDGDLSFNETNGDAEVAEGLLGAHDGLVAASDGASPSVGAYTYSEGLVALVQRAVNGDPTDFADFMGVRPPGSQVFVQAPTVVSPVILLNVIPRSGVSPSALEDPVQQIVQAYVNGLGIGDDVLVSEIIRIVKELDVVSDVHVVEPADNVPVADGQLARITADEVVVT